MMMMMMMMMMTLQAGVPDLQHVRTHAFTAIIGMHCNHILKWG
jgi:hypothetical protein